jgi:hypothetical protein
MNALYELLTRLMRPGDTILVGSVETYGKIGADVTICVKSVDGDEVKQVLSPSGQLSDMPEMLEPEPGKRNTGDVPEEA